MKNVFRAMLIVLAWSLFLSSIRADVITDWNSTMLDAIRNESTSPPLAARNMAIVHAAIFDAINAIDRICDPYLFHPNPPPGASPAAAAIGAAHESLVRLYPSQTALFEATLKRTLATVPPGQSRDDGFTLGQLVAFLTLAWRGADGSSTAFPYIPGTNPGDWRRTPPFFRPPELPQWPYVIPFTMTNGAQFRPAGPPSLISTQYTRDFNLVKDLGAINSTSRTPEQTLIARVDHRGDGFHKIALRTAALMFCASINAARPDGLRLFQLLGRDLVSKISIVQQITEHHRRGLCHRFRFYAGEDLFEEIYLSGKRVVFSDHVLQRFSARVPNHLGEDLSNFLLVFYGSPNISMPTGPGRAFILPYRESILALTYKETDSEYFVTTCLTIDELHSLEWEVPPREINLHYGPAFTPPCIRNWLPLQQMTDLYQCWERKAPLPPPSARLPNNNWRQSASWVRDVLRDQGHGPASRICFVDNIPGPCCLKIRPGEIEPRYDEMEIYKKMFPEHDWEDLCA